MTNKTTLKRLKLDPYFSKTIETNLNVWSHDQNSYEIKFEFYDHQCNKPIDLTGADMRILLDHADSQPKIYPLEVESKVLGLAKFIMPKEIRGCEGKFTAHIYADYPNKTHDFGSFTFYTKLSRLDGDLGGCMDEIYVSEFEKALEKFKEIEDKIEKNNLVSRSELEGYSYSKRYIDNSQNSQDKKINHLVDSVRYKDTEIMMSDLSQEVKESMTGESVAVVGINSVGDRNIKVDSVKAKNADFVELATENIFNKKVMIGYYVDNNSGEIYKDEKFSVSDFLCVKPNTSYRADSPSTTAFYDQDYKFISGVIGSESFTTPKEARFMRKTLYATQDINTYKIYEQKEDETKHHAFTPYKIKIKDLAQEKDFVELRVAKGNLLDYDNISEENVIGYSGKLVPSRFYDSSSLIKIDGGADYTFHNVTTILEYDKYGFVLPGAYREFPKDTVNTLTFSEKTRFLKVSFPHGEKSVYINKGKSITDKSDTKYAFFFDDNKIELEGAKRVENKKELNVTGYEKKIDSQVADIYVNNDASSKVMALYQDIAVMFNKSNQTLSISTNGINGDYKHSVVLNKNTLPNLLDYSFVHKIHILPWTRNQGAAMLATDWRMIVITSKGQIYHNFPSRDKTSDGQPVEGDIIRFDESVIWDLEERKFPTNKQSHSDKEYYFPVLPNENYNHYPPLNNDSLFKDIYGNGGFSIANEINGKKLVRFYRNGFDIDRNSFVTFNSIDISDNITMLGTYRMNAFEGKGVRTCVFATDDGGRQWYVKYEFADGNGTTLNWGSPINTNVIEGSYESNKLKVVKRTNVIPSSETKEPTNKFLLSEHSNVTSLQKGSPTIVTTENKHNLTTGNVIAFKNNSGGHAYDFIANDNLSENNHGNGIFFKIKVIDDNKFELYEYVHAWGNNIPCQHIHGINRVKDGFTVSTGEAYPMGWFLYIATHSADNYGAVKASHNMKIVRLNSSDKGLQRGIGLIIPDNAKEEVILASDTTVTPRGNISLPAGRHDTLSRSTSGVFRGKIADIDNFSEFECILECPEPSYYFKEINGIYIHIGQRGYTSISFDKGDHWHNFKLLGSDFYSPNGSNNNYVLAGDMIIVLHK